VSDEPTLRLVRGDAEPEELAALLAVLSARGGPDDADERPAAPLNGRWADPASSVRRRLDPGPGAWRSSGLPH
jgi:Acyl-CoA carboxylase epsilon subunit